ncbi:OsmC family protein [Planomicrobium sp. YIM 101495]|uniref:OsmC family protein n=1 Tax=Planomicrobium sp. YIM 101495 TaxID=2665160 RepID=UPI0012B9DB7E|nr:OsmC family protein [Planomicrobium sp. YIM 101495]MTD32096.1 OsmC family peroxiredoxin [Planomicrobium sp. YIM 101495]
MNFSMKENGFSANLPFGTLDVSGNEEYGFRPYQLLITSIAVCSGGVMRKTLEKMRMPVTDMQIEVKEVVRNDKEANRVEKVHLHFVLEGVIEESRMPRVLEVTRRNCSMVRSVEASIEVIETYELK